MGILNDPVRALHVLLPEHSQRLDDYAQITMDLEASPKLDREVVFDGFVSTYEHATGNQAYIEATLLGTSDYFASTETYSGHLALVAFSVLNHDQQQAAFLKLAELTAGTLQADGEWGRAARTQELGRRIIADRAQENAFHLLSSHVPSYELNPLFDSPDDGTLIARVAHTFQETDAISPFSNTYSVDGVRFDELLNAVYEQATKAQELPLLTGDNLEERLASLPQQRESDFVQFDVEPDTIDEGLTIAYDAMLAKQPVLNLTDEQAAFVGRFAAKSSRAFTAAALRVPEIAADPRTAFLTLLTGRLVAWNASNQLLLFEKGVAEAAKKATA